MKLSSILFAGVFLTLSYQTIAAPISVMCDEPQGPRVDYFTRNAANLDNNEFLVGKDQLPNMHIRLTIDDNHQNVSFLVGSPEQLASMKETNNMTVVNNSKEQISFFGEVNQSPLLATYFPEMSIIVYSQQAVWAGATFDGAQAVLFYAKCHDLNAKQVEINQGQGVPPLPPQPTGEQQQSGQAPSSSQAPAMTMPPAPTQQPQTMQPVPNTRQPMQAIPGTSTPANNPDAR